MRSAALYACLAALVLARDQPTDYWYRLCSKDTYKNEAVLKACPKTKNACLLKSELVQRSLFECYKAAESKSKRPKGDKVYRQSIAYMGDKLDGVPTLTLEDLRALDVSHPINQTYAEANKTESGAFQPRPKWLTELNIDAQTEWTWQHEWGQTLGQITMYYVFGIIVLQTLFNFFAWIAPVVARLLSNNPVSRVARRYVVMPALFNKHRSTPVRLFRYIQLCFPPRLHVVLIAGYLLIDIVCLAFHYPLIITKAVEADKTSLVGGYLAYRSAALVMYKLPLMFLFAGRNNFMIWLTGWQMEVFNHWHRWIARLATVDVLIHAISYTINDLHSGSYHTAKREGSGWWQAGIAAGVVMCLMVFQATKTFRVIAYEVFLYMHIVFAVAFVVTAWFHLQTRAFGLKQMWAVIAIWAFDRAVRILRIIVSGLNNKATIRCLPGGLMEITVKYSGLWKPRAGSYCFIHFSHPLLWFQSHPLSVVPVEGEKNTVKFVSKAQKGMTRIMHDRAAAAGGVLETRVWMDGEYGVQWPTKQFSEVILFAGGIGFTATYSHAIALLNSGSNQLIHFHWAISDRQPLEAFATEVANLSKFPNLRLTVHLNTGAAETEEKKEDTSSSSSVEGPALNIVPVSFAPDFFTLVQAHAQQSQGPIVFFSCGPPLMADAVRDAVSNNILSTSNYIQFYEESFTL